MIFPTICQVAVGMAATSLVLQLASAVGRGNRSTAEASTDLVGAAPPSAPKPKQAPIPTLVRKDGKPVVSLKLTAVELRAHARALGLRDGHWRKYANKNELCREIQAHYKQQEVARG